MNTSHEPVVSATKKSFGAIDAVPVSGRMHALQHKLYNVLIGWCQAVAGEGGGQGAESAAALPTEFTLQLSAVMDLCGFGPDKSRNYEHFQQVAESLMGFRVVYAGFQRLSQGILMANDTSLNKPRRRRRSEEPIDEDHVQLVSRIQFRWKDDELHIEFPKALARQLLAPEQFATLQWEQMLQFSSRAAFVLYEQMLRFSDEGQTPRRHWRDYSRLMTGESEPHKSFREFNKLLRRAVESVGQVTGRPLDVRQWKQGRFVEEIAILIGEPTQPSLSLHAVDTELLARLTSLGVSADVAAGLLQSIPPDIVTANIAYAQGERRKGRIKKLPGYLVAAIRSNYAATQAGQGRAPASLTAPAPTAATASPAILAPSPLDIHVKTVQSLPLSTRQLMLRQALDETPESSRRLMLPTAARSGEAAPDLLDDPRVVSFIAQWLMNARTGDAKAAAGTLSM